MKALTIHQPYASAIMAGLKRWENRTWSTRHRGVLLIHAGASEKWMIEAGEAALDGDPMCRTMWEALGDFRELPRSAILGAVNVLDCKPVESVEPDLFAHGPWCWELEVIRAADPPIPCSGRQGLWDCDINGLVADQGITANG